MTDTVPVPQEMLEDVVEELNLLIGEGEEVNEDLQDLQGNLQWCLNHVDDPTHAVKCRECGVLDGYGDEGALPRHKAYRVAGLHEGLETMHSVDVLPLVGNDEGVKT